jgi:hypothetical protein
MGKSLFTWMLLCITVTAFSTIFAQTPFVEFLPGGNGIAGVWQSSQGGYIAVTNDPYNQFIMIFRLDGQGDTLWSKHYSIYPSLSNRYSVSAAGASDGGCFILCGSRQDLGGSFNSVMKTNAQGDSILQPVTVYYLRVIL